MGTTFPGSDESSSAVAWRIGSFRLAMTTLAPAAARCFVMALPMPRPPPVTMAVLPVREMETDMISNFRFGRSRCVALEFEFGDGFAMDFVGAIGETESAGG